MNETITILSQIIGVALTLYGVPFLIRIGWNHAENRTKKVCDKCFRDISKFNKYLKENNL